MLSNGKGVMIATATGMTVVKSAIGCSSENWRRNMEIPVFWIPVSTAIAIASAFACLNNLDESHPKE